MRRPSQSVAALLLPVLLAACAAEEPPPPDPSPFTWIPIPGAVCSDGSGTGIGVEVGPSSDVLIFLAGGGACWDYLTCFVGRTAVPGPYGVAEFAEEVQQRLAGSILDRSLPGNPFADFTFVFVPYCTGDVHAGSTVRTYTYGAYAPRTWRHAGASNLAAAFARLATELEAPGRLVVAGVSAGGFGALYAFDLARQTWPGAQGILVDDSGPPLDEIPQTTVDAWYAQWDLGAVTTPLCGEPCQQDLSLAFGALASRYPDDRFALLSSTQDEVIRWFFGDLSDPYAPQPMAPATFEAGVRALAAGITDPGRTHSFLVAGTTHTMLVGPGAVASEGVPLLDWLQQQLDGDPAWGDLAPP